MGSYVEHFEDPEELDQARLQCLQSWTEKRLDTVVVTVLGKERDGYKLLCERQKNHKVTCWQCLII